MTSHASEKHANWTDRVHAIMAPHLHQVSYGNLRSEYTSWDEEDGTVANLAIVYEVPGGSTNQINVTHFDGRSMFVYLALDSHEERCTPSLDEVLAMVEEAVTRIPAIRHQRLLDDIDRWAASGMGQRDLFQKMNQLLQIEDLRGGTITMVEMKQGIAHILANYRIATA